ncbi:MAG: RluA family pseudouridine synthase [Chitinophagaceae bacterium]|jgi:23S rRNA pseudouridine955/2504/2580 synthase/23S rRNA pseudouridine1911/1915/1917 synthase|nr:RluA family pseudouridine synthase [Chitinophagaceae bacterium]
MRYEVILENDRFVAVNKPAGLLSIADRSGMGISLKQLLKAKYGEIFTVHRLDRETSGVVVFARDEVTHKALSQKFEGRDVQKYYFGLIHGKPVKTQGTIDVPITEHPGKQTKMMTHVKGKPSVTDYEVLESFKQYSWMQFRIHTGRTHQIRVHMQHIGNPIVCDDVYGKAEPLKISAIKGKKFKLSQDVLEERPILSRLALHSSKLNFELDGEQFNLEAELPKDLKATLQQLRKWGI